MGLCRQEASHKLSLGVRVLPRTWKPVVGCWDTVETPCSKPTGSWVACHACRTGDPDRPLVRVRVPVLVVVLVVVLVLAGQHRTIDDDEAEGLHNRDWCRSGALVVVDTAALVGGERLGGPSIRFSTEVEWAVLQWSVFAMYCAYGILRTKNRLANNFDLLSVS